MTLWSTLNEPPFTLTISEPTIVACTEVVRFSVFSGFIESDIIFAADDDVFTLADAGQQLIATRN